MRYKHTTSHQEAARAHSLASITVAFVSIAQAAVKTLTPILTLSLSKGEYTCIP